MVEWLEQNFIWVVIFALICVAGGLCFIIKNKRRRSKKSASINEDAFSLIDFVGSGTGQAKNPGFGGGSGGGGGSTRSFLPIHASNPDINELGKVAGAVVTDPPVTETVPFPMDELVNTVAQASPIEAVDIAPDADMLADIAETTMETMGDAAEAAVEVVGEVVSELLKF